MDSIKNFFKKKKLDVKFNKAGQGHSLASQQPQRRTPPQQRGPPPITRQGPPETAQRAAAAALERLSANKEPPKPTRSQQTIRNQAMRELEEAKAQGSHSFSGAKPADPVNNRPEIDHAPLLVDGVYYTCELMGDDVVLPKDLMAEAIEQFLSEQMSDEPVITSVLMIYSLGTNRELRITCIETLVTYLENIIENPKEMKFRKIRMGNKAFQERVLNVTGGKEFLLAIGFKEKMMKANEQSQPESFLILEEDLDRAELIQAKDTLRGGEGVPIRVYRNPKILANNSRPLSDFRVPDEFFALSSEEVKREQGAKAELVDKLETLRTREMREKEGYKPKYKYALLRIRFPDGKILQGTFGANEPFSKVREFVREHMQHDWAPFSLKCAGTELGHADDDKDLSQLQLAPAALLQFDMDTAIVAQITESLKGVKISFLKAHAVSLLGE